MNRVLLYPAFTFFLCLSPWEIHPQTSVETSFLEELVGIVVSAEEKTNSTDPEEYEVYLPLDLKEIISDFYAEATVPNTVTHGVLSYLSGIFSEHDYHAKGNWTSGTSPFRSYKSKKYVPLAGSLPDYEYDDFRVPVRGSLTSNYGYRPKFHRFHHGIDVALNLGDTVKCVLPGVVTQTGYQPGGYGRYIVVAHSGGLETLYGHLTATLVSPGESTEGGQPIGLGGSSGNATGPHLHFETRYFGTPVDPISWFNLAGRFR